MGHRTTGARGLVAATALTAVLLLGGCFNSPATNESVHFGDVSIGQQLIDLKVALEQGAIDEPEYDRLKQAMMALASGCGSDGDDE
jgi:hypothetical protein